MASTLTTTQGQIYDNIPELIHTIRGLQVMLDSDVAKLYGYETKRINEAANRNIGRFPQRFRFQLTSDELKNIKTSQCDNFFNSDEIIRSQIATLDSSNQGKHKKYNTYAYTEQGIAMLSGLLRNEIAIQVSVNIMDAFVEMRKILSNVGSTEFRVSSLETKMIENTQKIDQVFNCMEQAHKQTEGIIYKNQFYEAYSFLINLIKSANFSITIIDAYIDSFILELLLKNSKVDKIVIISQKKSAKELVKTSDKVTMIYSKDFHDRYVIIDNKEVYVFGASLKDLGNKVFTIFKLEDTKLFLSSVSELMENNQ
jgi:phage regulator Rha-like protein